MISVNLDSFEKATRIVAICSKYSKDIQVDVHCGHYIVDGASILGVLSCVGNWVTLQVITPNTSKYNGFIQEMSEIDGVTVGERNED